MATAQSLYRWTLIPLAFLAFTSISPFTSHVSCWVYLVREVFSKTGTIEMQRRLWPQIVCGQTPLLPGPFCREGHCLWRDWKHMLQSYKIDTTSFFKVSEDGNAVASDIFSRHKQNPRAFQNTRTQDHLKENIIMEFFLCSLKRRKILYIITGVCPLI